MQNRNQIDTRIFVIALLSFIPILGLVAAVYCIWRGWHIWTRRGIALKSIALAGATVTVVPLASYLVVRATGLDIRVNQERAQERMAEIITTLGKHRERHGYYPSRLSEVLGEDGLRSLALDPISPAGDAWFGALGRYQYFHYELLVGGERYFLFSNGPDGVPFTDDDVLPKRPPGLSGYEIPLRRRSKS